MREIYLDNAATTPVHPDVIEAITQCLKDDYGNPSSLHSLGIRAEKRMKDTKEQLAYLLGAESREIIFTSGGTESNNLAIIGGVTSRPRDGRHCITTLIEHPSVLNTFRYLEENGYQVTYLPVDQNGVVRIEDLKQSLRDDTVLVSVMHVNNEIGSVQPIDQIGQLLKGHKNHPLFHVDAIQSVGKIELSLKKWNVDMLSLSGHKIHAPKGVGALYIRKGVSLRPIIWGGEQEYGIRSGTENLPGISGLGRAVELIRQWQSEEPDRLYKLRMLFINQIRDFIPYACINCSQAAVMAPHIISVSFPGYRGEVLLHSLEQKGVYVSTGSACSSRKQRISHVLQSIGLDDKTAEGTLRFSIGYMNDAEEINIAVECLIKSLKELQLFKRR